MGDVCILPIVGAHGAPRDTAGHSGWGDERGKRYAVAKDRIDRDEEDLVRLYLTDIGQYTLLTKEDEVRLAKAIEAGKEATAKLAGTKTLNPSERRELRKAARDGEVAERAF